MKEKLLKFKSKSDKVNSLFMKLFNLQLNRKRSNRNLKVMLKSLGKNIPK